MGKIALGFEDIYKKLVAFYEKVLRWGLGHRKIVFIGAALLFVLSFSLIGFSFIGSEFMPNSDRGEFTIQLEGEPQNTLFQSNLLAEKVEKLLFSKPDVIKVSSNIGYSSSNIMSTGGSEQHKSQLTVTIIDKKQRKLTVEQYAEMIKKEILTTIPGLKVTVAAASMFGSSESPIQILLQGPDMNEIYKTSDKVMY